MEDFVFIAGLVLFAIFGPWVFVWLGHRRRRRERLLDEQNWSELRRRVYAVEQELRSFNKAVPAESATAASNIETPAEQVATPERLTAPLSQEPEPTIAQAAAASWVSRIPLSTPAPPPASTFAESKTVTDQPPYAVVEPPPSLTDRLKSGLDLEETLGTNWLNKLGIVILVLGVAFFLAYQLKTLGPAGKVLVGYLVSAVMLGAGIWFERGERYRILARAGIGGGWALLFFTTYAMYHVQAAHVLSSQGLDLILMLAVAAGMVWHTLRYRSQVVTGLTFLLALLTVTISHVSVYSLSAGAVLAAAMVVIVVRMNWFELEVFGMLASYLNHYLWLRPIIEPMQGKRRPFPEFAASAAILTLYWIIFRVSYVVRRPRNQRQERVSTIAALLNTVLLLALFKYQSTHPEWAFWALLAIGIVEIAMGQLQRTRQRRSAVIVLSTIGVILLIAAFPFRYSGTRLAVLWLLEAEALLLIGVWTKEIVFRRLGLLATGLVAGQMISFDAAQILGRRMDGADVRRDFRVALIFAVAAIVFYANGHWVFRRWRDLFSQEFDRRMMRQVSYVAALLAMVATWIAFPESWTAVAWAVLGLVLALLGTRFRLRELVYQANLVASATFFRALAINLNDTTKYHGLSLRLITLTLVAALLYLESRWSWIESAADRTFTFGSEVVPLSKWIAGTYTWAASFILGLLAWYELLPVSVAVAWVVLGLVPFEIGLSRRSIALRLQGYVAFIASFLRIFIVNLNASGTPGEISPRVYTVVPLAMVFFYAYWRLQSANELTPLERRWKGADFYSYLGTLTVAALMRFETPADWVSAAWAALAFVLFAVAWRTQHRVFLHQGLIIAFAVLFRTVLHNFYERNYFPASGWNSRLISVGVVVALLLGSMIIAFQLREKQAGLESGSEGRSRISRLLRSFAQRPEQVMFFLAVGILTVLLALEMRHGMVTVSWGVEAVAVFLVALWLGERSFRITGLGLLLLCVGKIVVVDVWQLNPRDRYLTFIILGSALLLVSFMYTRHREALRQYL